jgi:predicted unusual protein kinase regulating ubiquinone biosynthesis (AarF/ABC1/UbiB family)
MLIVFPGASQLLELGIGHGDISPGNICIADQGEDFL